MGFCPSCGQAVAEDARFCASCGTALKAGAGPREARKVVTALFADVVGSTSLGERMDPEDFNAVVGQAVARMAVAAESFGGEIIQLEGDGLLALFGASVSHEDDPERAILAALRIVDEIASYGEDVASEWGIEDFNVRAGIETGLVVVGPVGGGGAVRYGASGDALNTAARLQAHAPAGGILVGASTQRLVAEVFDWGEPKQLSLKGKAEHVVAYPVESARPDAAPRRPASIATALVGRGDELSAGLGVVDQLLGGSGGVLVVTGEAGLGKSRLVGELRKSLESTAAGDGRPARWLEGRCVSYGQDLPYWPFRGLIRELGEPATALPVVEHVLGTSAPDPSIPPEVLRARVQDAVSFLFEELAREAPLAVAIDDLHWADTSSLALVERLLATAAAAPILLVLIGRPDPNGPLAALRHRATGQLRGRAAHIQLEPLAEGSDRDLLASLVGEGTLPGELERRLLSRAEGNPLYLEELVGSMVGTGALERRDGEWRFDRDVPVEVPETVEKVILARIDQLDGPAHDLLGRAAVLGRQFPTLLLHAIAQSHDDISAPLAELEAADLLRPDASAPGRSHVFKHTLIQETAYRSLLKRHRQELHLAALDAIERLYAERLTEVWGMLAHHATAAGDDRRASEYHHRAGDAAQQLYAIDEALEHFDEAIEAAGRLGVTPADALLRMSLVRRGAVRYDQGDAAGSEADFRVALEGARAAGDRASQIEILTALAGTLRATDFARAVELQEEAVRVADSTGDPDPLIGALARLSLIYSNQARFGGALRAAERATQIAASRDEATLAIASDPLKLIAVQLGDLTRLEEITSRFIPVMRTMAVEFHYLEFFMLEAAFVPLARCRFEQALRGIEDALTVARERGMRMHQAPFIDALCWTYRSMGDYERAIEHGRMATELALEVGMREWSAWTDATLGWALLESHDAPGAIPVLERGIRTAEQAGVQGSLTRCVSLMAWARSAVGDSAGADAYAVRARDLLGAVEVPPGRAWLFGAHAYIAAARADIALGRPDRAEALLEPILPAAEESGWLEAIATATLVLGQARAAAGDAEAAEAALDRSLAVALEGHLPLPAEEARESLSRLSRRTRARLG